MGVSPGPSDWTVFMERLVHDTRKAKLLVVLMTPSWYKSKPCLQEIHTALRKKLIVIPILVETPIPKWNIKDTQGQARRNPEIWPTPAKNHGRHERMVDLVNTDFYALNCYPAPPKTISEDVEQLKEAIDVIEERLKL